MNFTEIISHNGIEDTYITNEWPYSDMGHSPVLLLYKKRHSKTEDYFSRIFIKIKNFTNSNAYNLINVNSLEKIPNSENKYYLRLYFHRLANYIDYVVPDTSIIIYAVAPRQNFSFEFGIGVYPEMVTPGFSFENVWYIYDTYDSVTYTIKTNDIERGYIDIELTYNMLQYNAFMIKLDNEETNHEDNKLGKSYGFCFHSFESNDESRRPKLMVCCTHMYNDYYDKIYGNTNNANITFYPLRDVGDDFYLTNVAGKNYKIRLSDDFDEYIITGTFSNNVYSVRFNSVRISTNYFFSLDNEYVKKYKYEFYIENTLMESRYCYLYRDIYATKNYEYRYDVLYRYMLSFNDGIQLNIYKYDKDESYIKKYVHQSLVNTIEVGDGFVPLSILPEYVYFEIFDPLIKKYVEINREVVRIYLNRDGYRGKFVSFLRLNEFLPKNKKFILKFYKHNGPPGVSQLIPKFLFEEEVVIT